MKNRIAIYARVSTAHQEDEQTIRNQTSILKEESQKRGYEVVKEYIDEGWSGDTLIRPALDQLRQDMTASSWDAVFIYDPDRLARRYSYQELVMDELREAGKEVVFYTVSAPKNSEDKILYGIRGIFAEYERTRIAERFRLGKLRKAKEGIFMGGKPCYGYDYVKKEGTTPGYYKINAIEADVVRRIFSWLVDDKLSLRQISKRLLDLGIPPKMSERKVWHPSTIGAILRHKVYIGQGFFGQRYYVVPKKPLKVERYRKVKKSSARMRPEEEWIPIPTPRIISDEVFAKAAEQLTVNFKLSKRNARIQYLLRGILCCACGYKMSGAGSYKGNPYYRCNQKMYVYPEKSMCSVQHNGIGSNLENMVWENIQNFFANPANIEQSIGKLEQSLKNDEDRSGKLEAIASQIRALKGKEERYHKAFAEGVFDIEKLKTYVVPIKKAIDDIEKVYMRESGKNRKSIKTLPDRSTIKSFVRQLNSQLRNLSFDQKRSLLLMLVEKIEVNTKEIVITGHLPITQIDSNQSSQDGRPSPYTNIFSALCRNGHHDVDTIHNRKVEIPFEFRIKIKENTKCQ